ncbi:hypothetical protein SAMN05421831_101391 [Allopseudospirillum japonicum]|uniref:Uncharacterized protein n=1 Tax=Allopseudospirillum japonicum TaxID=64971 RepID=A0A1H6QR67_9GAMM|nr:hypothetical protein [Allopseudospirillum japonicum]SEI41472.1 hypothetical protein SAMN05421831_101391 [Allopseudospirillum japonicum]
MIFVEQLTQMITRSFSSYKKREFQTFGGIDVFKFLPSDMYATADLLLGNEIDRAKYPTLNNPAVLKKNTQVGKPVIVRVHSRRPIRIIKAKDIRPSRKKVDADTSSG